MTQSFAATIGSHYSVPVVCGRRGPTRLHGHQMGDREGPCRRVLHMAPPYGGGPKEVLRRTSEKLFLRLFSPILAVCFVRYLGRTGT